MQEIKVIVLALIMALGVSYVEAVWTAPNGAPPNNNATAPINVGISNQAKGGVVVPGSTLSIYGIFSTDDALVFNLAKSAPVNASKQGKWVIPGVGMPAQAPVCADVNGKLIICN